MSTLQDRIDLAEMTLEEEKSQKDDRISELEDEVRELKRELS